MTPTLKAGDTKEFKFGTDILIVEPIPLGVLKKIIKIIADAGATFDKKTINDDFLNVVPKLVESYIDTLIPLLFVKAKHPFLTTEWIDDNLTVPTMKDILMAAIAVNGLGDFFLRTVKAPAPVTVPDAASGTPKTETSSEKSGSITSSESPTDGDLKTLTS